MEYGTLESFATFPFESYMRKIRRSGHCGFAAAKQAAQRYAEEVYFQSIHNQDMADNVTEPEVTDDSSKQMHQSRKYILVDDKENKQVVCIPNKWLLNNDHYVYRDDVSEQDIIEGVDFGSRFCVRKCTVIHRCDNYSVAQQIKVCLTTALGYNNNNLSRNDETQPCEAEKPKRTVKRKHKIYLCTSEELEVEAGFAPVGFPVVNILTGTFSPIASSSSKADVSSPPLPRSSTEVDKPLCDDTNKMLRTLLKSVSELSTKIDKILILCERLAMGVTDRRTEGMDSDAIHFPLRTHEELRSLEAALENQKYRDHFVSCKRCLDKF
ncbi:unnamed protein product [Schistosoma curassoni]|uniref:DUF4806 domain-containing protein n=1 Tax=Schistosoma curassoni TaxID=6186 RepID=A0A183L0U3_9TREM|nr:unnamed protein product [Schistosoma curassoni]